MRAYILVISAVLVGIVADDKYTTKYDDIDVDALLKNERLLRNYLDCIMEKGNCTPDGSELKKNIPDALVTSCSKCSDKQKTITKQILKHLVKSKRDWFDEIAAKYDSEGVFRAQNRDEFAKEGIDF